METEVRVLDADLRRVTADCPSARIREPQVAILPRNVTILALERSHAYGSIVELQDRTGTCALPREE
jgi:hypothetical protein